MDKFRTKIRQWFNSSSNIPFKQCPVGSQTNPKQDYLIYLETDSSHKGPVCSPTIPYSLCHPCTTDSLASPSQKSSKGSKTNPCPMSTSIAPRSMGSPNNLYPTGLLITPCSRGSPTNPCQKGLQGLSNNPYPSGSPITAYPIVLPLIPCPNSSSTIPISFCSAAIPPTVGTPPTSPPEGSPKPSCSQGSSKFRCSKSLKILPFPEHGSISPCPQDSLKVPSPKGGKIAPCPERVSIGPCPVSSSSAPCQKTPYSPPVKPCPLSPPKVPQQQDPSPPPPHRIEWHDYLVDAWLKFRLLMWKNFLQQWRRPLQTVAEIFLPILTMTFVLIIRWQIAPAPRGMTSYPPLPAYSLVYSMEVVSGMEAGTFSIAYSPTSPILQDVVMSGLAALISKNDNLLIGFLGITQRKQPYLRNKNSKRYRTIIEAYLKNNSQVQAFDTSNDLKRLYAKENTTRTVLAAVEFDDSLYGATALPIHNITYSLRFPERPRQNSFYRIGGRDWKTELVFPNYELPGPRFPYSYEGGNDPGYVNELFIALQHAISMELISRLTGQNIDQLFNVIIQRFPHPPYWEDFSLTVMKILFPMFVMLSTSYSAINIVRAIVVEKELQLKESMKIMGLPTWLHWTAWFWKQFFFQLLIAIIMVILLKVHWFTNEEGYSNYAVFTHTPWTVLMFFLLLYLCCMIFFCFMLSAFFSKGSTAALFTGVIWFLTFMPTFLLSTDAKISIIGQILSCLFINTAMAFGFQLIQARECSGGMQWGKFLSSPSTERSRFMFGHVVIMLVVNCVLYMLITLYFEQVFPGPFGAPRPWNFLFQSEFWRPGRKLGTKVKDDGKEDKVKDAVTGPSTERFKPQPLHALYVSVVHAYQAAVKIIRRNNVPDERDEYNIVHEKDPENHSIGVIIQNLTKVFGRNTIINNLNLNVYNDQITVLLGHNGAGKTTTISMITGNLEPTSGKVTVAGYDMSTQAHEARSHIGLCPQHNVLFDELTVREHLKFFSRLKGLTGTELNADIEELIKKLELQSKRDYQSKGLSGGQKRRLCVGIALSGKAKVVLLDEPTSGMDPSSRRALWDLLQKEKKQRSMILTTHFMDEADILGDRVAIMAQGKLQCVGSPYFLKRHYGVGYTLVVVKDKNFDTKRCTALINNYIPGTVVKEDRGSEVTYSLPNDYSHNFEDMLNNLEQNAKSIKFTNYGLLTTTLEDVFMSVGADLAPVNMQQNREDKDHTKKLATADEKDTNEITSALEQFNSPKSTKTGYPLILQRIWAVWLKLALVWRRSWWLVLLQFVIPTLLLNAALGLLQYILSLVPIIKKRLLSLTTGFEQTETLLGCDSNSTVSVLAAEAYQEIFENADLDHMTLTPIGEVPIQEYYLNRARDPLTMGSLRYRILIGSTFSDDSVTAWFSNFGYHDVAISLAAVHSALLKTYNPDTELTVYNHPLKATYADQTDMQMMISLISMQLSTGIGSSVAITTAVYIMFYIKERVSGAKLLQKSAGLQPILMWGSSAVYDWVWLLIFCLPIPISCGIFKVPGLSTAPELARLWLCIMLYGAAMMPLTYLLSLVFNGPALGFVCYFFLNVLLGMLGAQIVESLLSPSVETTAVADAIDAILQFHPLYCLVTSVRYLNQIGLRRKKCFQMCDFYKIIYDEFVCTKEALCELDDTCCRNCLLNNFR